MPPHCEEQKTTEETVLESDTLRHIVQSGTGQTSYGQLAAQKWTWWPYKRAIKMLFPSSLGYLVVPNRTILWLLENARGP